MYYYRFTTNTCYPDTNFSICEAFEKKPTDKELKIISWLYCDKNAARHEHLVTNTIDIIDECSQETANKLLADYYNSCTDSYEEITEEEYIGKDF